MIARLLFLAVVVPCAWVRAEPVTLSEALRSALERDATFVIERLGGERELVEAERAERGLLGRVSLKSAGGRASTSEFGDRREATASAGLQLPAAGGRSVSVDVRHSFSLTSSRTVDEMYAYDPQLSVTWKQSLVEGAFPGRGLARAARSGPTAQRAGALASLDEARNKALLRAARLYYGVAEQRRGVELAEARLVERRAEAENLERGASLRLGGQQEAQRLRLSIREDELALAAAKGALARLEPDLAGLLGRAVGELQYEIPKLELDRSESELRSKALIANGSIRRADSVLKARRADAALSALTDAPALNVAVTVDGDYETTDTVPRTLDQSLSELRPKLTLSVLLDLPLGRRRDRELARSSAAALELQAATERSRVEAAVVADFAELVAERSRLAELIGLRERQVELARDELRVRGELLAARQTTPAEVAAARLDLEERKLTLWRSRADLFLADLELAALAGEDLSRLLLTAPR